MYVPSILITIEPLLGSTKGVVVTTKFPSISLSPISVKSPFTGMLTEVVWYSLSTTGASLIGNTVTNNVSLTQAIGIGVPLSHTV